MTKEEQEDFKKIVQTFTVENSKLRELVEAQEKLQQKTEEGFKSMQFYEEWSQETAELKSKIQELKSKL